MCFCRYFVSLSQVRYEHPYQKEIPVSVTDAGIFLRFLENFVTESWGISGVRFRVSLIVSLKR